MGAVGTSSSLINKPSAEAEKYTIFKNDGAGKWFANEKDSNLTEWQDGLTPGEKTALGHYTGHGYTQMNNSLYKKPWDELDAHEKKEMANLYNALGKFDLKRGISVTRQTDFQIFGAMDKTTKMTVDQVKEYLAPSNGVLQNDAFMSFSSNEHGVPIAGSGLVIHLQVPPSKGAGAYVAPLSSFKSEQEYLLNNNAVMKFDINSVEEKGGKIHVTAQWLGQAKQQTIDPNNKSVYAKKK